MTWFRVDDGLAFHHKVVGVGNAAMGLWVRSGSWCAQQGNDGVVPAHMVKALGGALQHARALVAFGLWEDPDNGTFLFHDWHLFQPSSAEIKAARLARNEVKVRAGQAGGIASGVSRRANKEAEPKQTGSRTEAQAQANVKENEAPSRPVPSLPSIPQPAAASSGRDLAFEEFWLVYPRKIGKGSARKAWAKAIKLHKVEDIMAGVQRFVRQPVREEHFTPYPATWLNSERWLDQPVRVDTGNPATAWAREQG